MHTCIYEYCYWKVLIITWYNSFRLSLYHTCNHHIRGTYKISTDTSLRQSLEIVNNKKNVKNMPYYVVNTGCWSFGTAQCALLCRHRGYWIRANKRLCLHTSIQFASVLLFFRSTFRNGVFSSQLICTQRIHACLGHLISKCQLYGGRHATVVGSLKLILNSNITKSRFLDAYVSDAQSLWRFDCALCKIVERYAHWIKCFE